VQYLIFPVTVLGYLSRAVHVGAKVHREPEVHREGKAEVEYAEPFSAEDAGEVDRRDEDEPLPPDFAHAGPEYVRAYARRDAAEGRGERYGKPVSFHLRFLSASY